MSGNTFYLTLPSNDGSLKYFPDNKNNSWKNRLDKRIDLEGEWEVELSSISLPHDSKMSSYLKGLKDDDVLLTTGRIKVATGDIQHKVTYNAKHLWQLLPEFGQISRRASALPPGMFWVTTHLRGKYHWGSDLGLFPLDLNQGTGQVTPKWPQPFYREDARRTLDKHGGIHKPER